MDAATFDEFYQSSFARLVGQIHAMCGNLGDAQDAVQEAFIRAWDHRRELDADRNPEAWVRTTAHRLAVSRWRKATRAFRQPDRALEHHTAPEPNPDHVLLTRALAQLPLAQRQAIVLHHLCDLSVEDIAAEVGAPAGTVKARLARGRQALAKILSSEKEASHV